MSYDSWKLRAPEDEQIELDRSLSDHDEQDEADTPEDDGEPVATEPDDQHNVEDAR